MGAGRCAHNSPEIRWPAMGALAVLGVCGLMKCWYGRAASLFVALAVVMHPWFFEVTRRVRPEIYYVALSLLSAWALTEGVRSDSRRTVIFCGATWGALAGMAALAHPTGLLSCGAFLLAMLATTHPVRRLMRALTPAAAGAALPVLPFVCYVIAVTAGAGEVDFTAQMRSTHTWLGLTGAGMLRTEFARWAHFLQWPRGAPLALVLLGAWLAAWRGGAREDRVAALTILIFACALPFGSTNVTSRYLSPLIPFLAALVVRLVWRVLAGMRPGAAHAGHLARRGFAAAVVLIYAGSGLVAIGLMLYRLHDCDPERLLARVAAAVGPTARVCGPPLLFMGQGSFQPGPYVYEDARPNRMAAVVRLRMDYCVRFGWNWWESHGVSSPPLQMPPLGSGFEDELCRAHGRKVAESWDPYYGPFEIHRLTWD